VALSPRGPAPDFAVHVPPGRYFVMSDNRAGASDSRRFGSVRREDLLGPVVLVYWSWERPPGERAAGASVARALPFARPRWSRIGRGVE
jgi:hypothetical protein